MSETSHMSIKIARTGEKVTTISQFGAVGVGYLYEGEVWKSTGSYFAVKAKQDVGGMKRFIRDGGDAYRKAVKKLASSSI